MKKIYYTLIAFTLSTHFCFSQSLKINEVMNLNTSTLKDNSGGYNPWVEIYNTDANPIDLTGYYLSNHSFSLNKWKFPSASIPGNGFLIVYIGGSNKLNSADLHTNFSISTDWEGIFLSNPSGQLIDHCNRVLMQRDISYGRTPDGTGSFGFFDIPTPGTSNNTSSYSGITAAPVLSVPSGFYTNPFFVSINNGDPTAQIRYTTDGSDPVATSALYIDPISINNRTGDPNVFSNIPSTFPNYWQGPSVPVEKHTVIKARAFKNGYLPGEVTTKTYFVSSNIHSRFKIPVVSLSTDPDNFFDYNRGIYVPGKLYTDFAASNSSTPGEGTPANFNMKGLAWTRPLHVDFFEADGRLGFSQTVGTNIHGSYSRLFRQHAINLKAHQGFGLLNEFDYPIFPDLSPKKNNGISNLNHKQTGSDYMTKFRTIILRNNGSDWGHTMFRDALAENLLSHRMIVTQAYRPCAVFLNGEYWGIHDLREKFDREFLSSHYGINKDSTVILYNEGIIYEGDSAFESDYTDMVTFISSNDLSNEGNYDLVKTKMDVENYAEFYAVEIFSNNKDWPGSNIRFWKKTTPYNAHTEYGHDGRWRWGVQDVDLGFGSDQPNGDYTFNSLNLCMQAGGTVWPNPDWSTTIFINLLKNTTFKNLFVNTMADHMNSTYRSSRVLQMIDEMKAAIEPEMPAHIARWGAPSTMNDWYAEIDKLKEFSLNRPFYQKQHIMNKFGLTDTTSVNLNVSGTNQGLIKINTIMVDRRLPGVSSNVYPWQGTYFAGVPITVEAIPYPGYKFVRWEGSDSSTDPIITLANNSNESVTAIFEKDVPFIPSSGNVSLFPNPNQGILNLEFNDENNGSIYVFVYDRWGKEVYSTGINKTQKALIQELDLSSLSDKTYFLHVKSSTGKLYKKKFIIEK